MTVIRKLIRAVRQAGAYREADSERDGFLSYAAEVHAAGHGLYDGMRTWRLRPRGLPENPDVQAEPHYYKGAYVLGTLFQLGIAIVLATNWL